MMNIEKDGKGSWEVTEKDNCKVRLLIKPSKLFTDWQASNPIVKITQPRDLLAEIDALKTRLSNLESPLSIGE